MLDFYNKSLRNKLLVIFIIIGLTPFITLLVYTLFLSQNKIVAKTVTEQLNKTKVVIKLIDNHLQSLDKEVKFLSSLDVMDDILADDIDKRISRLLKQKADDLNLEADFFVVTQDGNVIASSNSSSISKHYDLSNLKSLNAYKITDKTLYLYTEIKSSFDNTQTIALLILEYRLNNLDNYLTHSKNVHSYISNSTFSSIIGEKLDSKIDFISDSGNIIEDKNLVVYAKMHSFLDDFYLVYSVDKDVALEFLYDFIRFMIYIAAIIFLFIFYISFKESKKIVKPIADLTNITKEITSTQNYSTSLEVSSLDEIGVLTHSFNEMLQVTSSALIKLEKENKLRLQRFTQLIDVFNKIIQTKDEDECINISISEIKKLTSQENLVFNKDKETKRTGANTEIYVTDFENDSKIYFGSISLGIDKFEDIHEEDFYNSISSMITLQLDKIKLIDRTMSASRAKSTFISNMSHELRTPLNAIIGFSQFMIEYEELNDEQNDIVTNIESSAQYLLSMINEILDMAKIEAGKMEAHMESIDALNILQNSYNMLKPLASKKNLQFELESDKYTPIQFQSDPKMLQQIVVNLMSNAIKFTEKGMVVLSLENDDSYLTISVQDTGVGLSQDDMKLLFNDFTQIENVMQKQHKGTGLGLSLSKQMAQLLGGDIEMYSDGRDCGTTAVLKLKI